MAKKYDHLRTKARKFRKQGLSISEICDRFKLSKGTVWHWIKDIPLQRETNISAREAARQKGVKANKEKCKRLREEAYEQGKLEYKVLSKDPTFRDFVCMYLGEGYRKDRNQVSICNSNPTIVKLSNKWITKLSSNKVTYWIQYHEDQDPEKLRLFWKEKLRIGTEIKLQRKSNSSKLKGRNWRSEHGVLTVRTSDTYLRAKIQAWMDTVQSEW